MITKQDLREYMDIKRELRLISRQITELKLLAKSPRVQVITGMPGGGAHGGVSDVAIKLVDMQAEYDAKQEDMLDKLRKIGKDVDKLPSKERQIIRLHYFFGASWKIIAADMGYSLRQVHRAHSKALQKLNNL